MHPLALCICNCGDGVGHQTCGGAVTCYGSDEGLCELTALVPSSPEIRAAAAEMEQQGEWGPRQEVPISTRVVSGADFQCLQHHFVVGMMEGSNLK